MPIAVILDAVRTARGKRKGSLASVHPVDLAAHVLRAALERTGLAAEAVDDVVLGCVTQVGEQGLNVARGAVLAAGLPVELAGKTVNRLCGSGLQAVDDVACAVLAGRVDVAIGGGVESMSRAPLGSDYLGGEGPTSPGLAAHFPGLVPQGLSAELVAEAWGLSRGELDAFSAGSQEKAARARAEGHFVKEIVAVPVRGPDGVERSFAEDEHLRPGTTVQTLASLKPAFREDGVIHAGQLLGHRGTGPPPWWWPRLQGGARRPGHSPEGAGQVAAPSIGSEPVDHADRARPFHATKALAQDARHGASSDMDLWEMNEAFAPVVLRYVARELVHPARARST
jgi:acetyl-CoA acyltransferase